MKNQDKASGGQKSGNAAIGASPSQALLIA